MCVPHVCIYTCVCVYMCVCVCTCVCSGLHVCARARVRVRVCATVCVGTVCLRAGVYVCMYTCEYEYTSIRVSPPAQDAGSSRDQCQGHGGAGAASHFSRRPQRDHHVLHGGHQRRWLHRQQEWLPGACIGLHTSTACSVV